MNDVKAQGVIIGAVKNASNKAGPALENLLEIHLRNTEGKGFELAFEDPKRFKEAVIKLFGEYSGRLLELLIIQELKMMLEIDEEVERLENIVEMIKKSDL